MIRNQAQRTPAENEKAIDESPAVPDKLRFFEEHAAAPTPRMVGRARHQRGPSKIEPR